MSGATAYEVYRESFKEQLTLKQQKRMGERVTDLEKWRLICDQWMESGYYARNLKDLFKVYDNGWQQKGKGNAGGQSANNDGVWTQWATPVITGDPINAEDINF